MKYNKLAAALRYFFMFVPACLLLFFGWLSDICEKSLMFLDKVLPKVR